MVDITLLANGIGSTRPVYLSSIHLSLHLQTPFLTSVSPFFAAIKSIWNENETIGCFHSRTVDVNSIYTVSLYPLFTYPSRSQQSNSPISQLNDIFSFLLSLSISISPRYIIGFPILSDARVPKVVDEFLATQRSYGGPPWLYRKVCPSVCHTRKSRLNDSEYRNMLYTT